MRNTSYIQFCNENAGRAYPLREAASRTDDSGKVMPDNILLDMCLSVPPAFEQCFLSSMRVTSTTISFGISSATSGMFVFTAAWYDLLSGIGPGWDSYPLTPVVQDISGWIVVNRFDPSMIGDWHFSSYAQSGIETRAVRVVDSLPIRSMLRLDMDPILYFGGVVKLIGGSGVQIVKDDTNPQKIIVKLTPDAKAAMLGPCNEQATTKICGVPPLRSINGVCPDASGRINLRFE